MNKSIDSKYTRNFNKSIDHRRTPKDVRIKKKRNMRVLSTNPSEAIEIEGSIDDSISQGSVDINLPEIKVSMSNSVSKPKKTKQKVESRKSKMHIRIPKNPEASSKTIASSIKTRSGKFNF